MCKGYAAFSNMQGYALKTVNMHIKSKYIQAIENAIDFISHNADGASDEQSERETISILREISAKMKVSQHKKRVNYYVSKHSA